MATIDLHALSGDEFVFHFGGKPREVNAFTFANSILAFSEALKEINKQINPEFSLEITIDALGSGSFRTRLKTTARRISGLFRGSAKELIIGILAAMIYEKTLGDGIQIIVTDDSYIVQRGSDRVVLPKEVYEATKNLKAPEIIDNHISRAFESLDDDPSITEFGIQ
jgi:hypothetical protein